MLARRGGLRPPSPFLLRFSPLAARDRRIAAGTTELDLETGNRARIRVTDVTRFAWPQSRTDLEAAGRVKVDARRSLAIDRGYDLLEAT